MYSYDDGQGIVYVFSAEEVAARGPRETLEQECQRIRTAHVDAWIRDILGG
jgi:hypothetical protein